jgi:hypothetical protein
MVECWDGLSSRPVFLELAGVIATLRQAAWCSRRLDESTVMSTRKPRSELGLFLNAPRRRIDRDACPLGVIVDRLVERLADVLMVTDAKWQFTDVGADGY